jgi:hypothetical protein
VREVGNDFSEEKIEHHIATYLHIKICPASTLSSFSRSWTRLRNIPLQLDFLSNPLKPEIWKRNVIKNDPEGVKHE